MARAPIHPGEHLAKEQHNVFAAELARHPTCQK